MNQLRGLASVARLIGQRNQVRNGGRKPRVDVQHVVERVGGLAERLVEQAAEMDVKLSEHVPRVRIPGGHLRGALEPVESGLAVAVGDQASETLEQQAVRTRKPALVTFRPAEGGTKPLFRGIDLGRDEGKAQPPDSEIGVSLDHTRVFVSRRAVSAATGRGYRVQ